MRRHSEPVTLFWRQVSGAFNYNQEVSRSARLTVHQKHPLEFGIRGLKVRGTLTNQSSEFNMVASFTDTE